MARLIIVYGENIEAFPQDVARDKNIKQAIIDVSEGLENQDIYSLARKLAEMLLEQL